MRVRVLDEDDIRGMDFYFAATEVVAGGEVDIFRPVGDDDQLEIRVSMEPFKHGNAPTVMNYAGIAIVNTRPDGLPLRIMGEDNRSLDRELVEVMAWEKVEEDEHAVWDYSYGRPPAKAENGQRAPVGSIIERARRPEPQGIVPEF